MSPTRHARTASGATFLRMSEAEKACLMRTDWGFVHQDPADGLRDAVSAAPMSASG